MATVLIPQKKRDDQLNKLLEGGGAAIGAYYGGEGGAAAGAQAGRDSGNIFNAQAPAPQTIQTNSDSSAMARRMRQLSEDRLAVLRQSEAALAELPEPLRRQYAPAIVEARMLEEQKRRGVS